MGAVVSAQPLRANCEDVQTELTILFVGSERSTWQHSFASLRRVGAALAVVDRDLFAMPADAIGAGHVVQTWLAGVVVPDEDWGMRPCSVTPVASREARASMYDAVLSPSFGPEELPPREQFLAWTARDELEVLLATDPETGDTLGCAVVALRQGAPQVALLAWLAVRPGLRGTGTGGALLDAAIDLARDAGAHLLLAEVEDPRKHPASADHGNPWRRLGFYARNDLALLDLPYFLPPMAPGQERVPDMLMLASVLRDGADSPEVLRPALVAFLRAFVPRLDGDDPDHDALLAAAAEVTAEPLADVLERAGR